MQFRDDEVVVVLSEDEARAMVPSPHDRTIEGWNRKADLMEDAVAKIRAAIRQWGVVKQPEEQASLDGMPT